MRFIPWAVLSVVLLCGCGKPPPPTLSGGKPVSHWIEALQNSGDAKLRKEAAFKLGNVGPAAPEALAALVAALKDSDATVRAEAIVALVKFGSAATEAIPILTELRDRDRDAKVRTYATKALKKLQN